MYVNDIYIYKYEVCVCIYMEIIRNIYDSIIYICTYTICVYLNIDL